MRATISISRFTSMGKYPAEGEYNSATGNDRNRFGFGGFFPLICLSSIKAFRDCTKNSFCVFSIRIRQG